MTDKFEYATELGLSSLYLQKIRVRIRDTAHSNITDTSLFEKCMRNTSSAYIITNIEVATRKEVKQLTLLNF